MDSPLFQTLHARIYRQGSCSPVHAEHNETYFWVDTHRFALYVIQWLSGVGENRRARVVRGVFLVCFRQPASFLRKFKSGTSDQEFNYFWITDNNTEFREGLVLWIKASLSYSIIDKQFVCSVFTHLNDQKVQTLQEVPRGRETDGVGTFLMCNYSRNLFSLGFKP